MGTLSATDPSDIDITERYLQLLFCMYEQKHYVKGLYTSNPYHTISVSEGEINGWGSSKIQQVQTTWIPHSPISRAGILQHPHTTVQRDTFTMINQKRHMATVYPVSYSAKHRLF